jgi:uncharacterized RDD family membrane protein YckC
MKTTEIITSHNITIEYQLASVMERFLALLIDTAVLVVWALIWSIVLGGFRNQETLLVFFLLFIYLPIVFYHLVCEMFFGGQSVGKKALGIKVVGMNGKNPSPSESLLRWIFRSIDLTLSVGTIAVLYASASEKGQRIGDQVARTLVIKLNPTNSYSIKDILGIRDAATHGDAMYPQVTTLTDEDMLLIKNAIERVRMYPNDAHRKLIDELCIRVSETLKVEPPSKDKIQFLRTLLSDYIVLTR